MSDTDGNQEQDAATPLPDDTAAPAAFAAEDGRMEADAMVADAVDADLLMSVEVPVKFRLGESRLTLQQLSSLRPGFVFETTTSVNQPVTIEVNGAAVGTGDVVVVGDRIGVVLREQLGNG